MRVVVISCDKYRDAWVPFLAFLDKFWPDHPRPVHLITDHMPPRFKFNGTTPNVFSGPQYVNWSWCYLLETYARGVSEPICLFQEDFFLSQPVNTEVVERGLKLVESGAGCARLYPSPGGTANIGDPFFAEVPRGTRYRISCHAAIYDPAYLADVARGAAWTTGEAGDFENLGTPFAEALPQSVLAVKRELNPWPMDYLASAIRRGKWEPDAIKLCAEHGVELDRSMREVSEVAYR